MNPKYLIVTLISSALCFSCSQGSTSNNEHTDILPTPVVNTAPVANFSYTIADNDVSFKNYSADEDGDTLSYEWSMNNSITSEQFEPVQTFSAGEHEITLHVSDGKLTSSITKSITVAEVIVVPTVNLIEAEDYSASFGDLVLENSGNTLGKFDNNDYVVYENVDLSDVKQITTYYSAINNKSFLELRLNTTDGQLFAVVQLDTTNDLSTFQEKQTSIINPVSGVHNLYIKGVGSNTDHISSLDYFILDKQNTPVTGTDEYTLDEQNTGLCLINGDIESNHEGYTGSGFINTDNTHGSAINWVMNVTQAGVYPITFTFANGGESSRSGILTVNGAGAQTVDFNSTGAWATWQTETLNISLEEGVNTLSIVADSGDGLANIDKATLNGDGLTDPDCPEIIIPIHSGPLLSQVGNPVHNRYNKYKTQWGKDKADIILSYQYDNGGWPKNQEYTSMGTGGSGVGATIDNGATTLEMTYLANLYREDKVIKYRDAARKAMDYLLAAQYPSGGWPQFYPLKGGYADHVTFNDDAMSRVLTVLYHAIKQSAPFDTDIFDDADRLSIQQAIDKGVDYILKSQWVQQGKLTVWCAQHGAVDYLPKSARAYELESLSGSESEEIIAFLMTQPQSTEIKAAIDGALAWYRSPNTYLADFIYSSSVEEKIIASPGGRMWYRFYDLTTNKGFFSDRDGGTYYDLMDISAERRNGYSWGGNYGETIINYAESVGY